MISDRAKLEAADIGFRTEWNLAIEKMRGQTLWERFATETPSSHRSEQYNWVTALPRMHEWLSDAQFTQLKAYKYTLENKTYQMGLEVKREDILDDNLGIIKPAIAMLGENAIRHPDELIFALLNAGFAGTKGLAYDGQYFFDTDHQDGAGPVQSNKGTAALTPTSYGAARAAMMSLQDEAGQPLSIRPTVLVIPPLLEAAAKNLIAADRLASGASNIYFNTAEIIICPLLTSATAWFLFDFSKMLRPFVFQRREPLQFMNQDKMDDEHAFMRRVFRYSAFARYNAGYGLWQMSYGSTGTT